jgi:hypothetical protein
MDENDQFEQLLNGEHVSKVSGMDDLHQGTVIRDVRTWNEKLDDRYSYSECNGEHTKPELIIRSLTGVYNLFGTLIERQKDSPNDVENIEKLKARCFEDWDDISLKMQKCLDQLKLHISECTDKSGCLFVNADIITNLRKAILERIELVM